MRKTTVRTAVRTISAGIVSLMAATFYHSQLAGLFSLGVEGEARLTFYGFFLSGLLGGFGALVLALGLLQSGTGQARIRLMPSLMLLFSLLALFFVLTYTSITAPPSPVLEPGESISI